MNFGSFLDKMEGFREEFQNFPLSFCNIEVLEPKSGDKFEVMGYYPEDGPIDVPVEALRVVTVEMEEVRFDVDKVDDLIGVLEDIKKDSLKDPLKEGKKDHLRSVSVRVGDEEEYVKVSKVCNAEDVVIRRKRVKMI